MSRQRASIYQPWGDWQDAIEYADVGDCPHCNAAMIDLRGFERVLFDDADRAVGHVRCVEHAEAEPEGDGESAQGCDDYLGTSASATSLAVEDRWVREQTGPRADVDVWL